MLRIGAFIESLGVLNDGEQSNDLDSYSGRLAEAQPIFENS
jgi:hypothetical protein